MLRYLLGAVVGFVLGAYVGIRLWEHADPYSDGPSVVFFFFVLGTWGAIIACVMIKVIPAIRRRAVGRQ